MRAVLQFKDYHVIESVYRYNPFDDSNSFSISPEFDFTVLQEQNNPFNAMVELSITVGDELLKNQPVYVHVKVLGVFEIKEAAELAEEEVLNFFRVNAVAILYPYLRSLVSDLTSKGSEAPIILPTMNIVEMMRKQVQTNPVEQD